MFVLVKNMEYINICFSNRRSFLKTVNSYVKESIKYCLDNNNRYAILNLKDGDIYIDISIPENEDDVFVNIINDKHHRDYPNLEKLLYDNINTSWQKYYDESVEENYLEREFRNSIIFDSREW